MNAPLTWPNNSLSSNVSDSAAQLIATKGLLARRLPAMDRAGHQFLAGTAFACDEDGRVGRRRPEPVGRTAFASLGFDLGFHRRGFVSTRVAQASYLLVSCRWSIAR